MLGTNTVEFDASSSYGHGQEIKSYAWDFGDGKTAEGAKVSHTFADATYASYWVTLTVTDTAGAKDSVKQRVVIAPDYLPAQTVEGDLTDGYRYEGWSATWAKVRGDEAKKEFMEKTLVTEPAVNVGIEKFQFARKEKQPGLGRKAGLRRLSGYLKVPADGWYAFAVMYEQQLLINDLPVLSHDRYLKQTYVSPESRLPLVQPHWRHPGRLHAFFVDDPGRSARAS